MHLDMLEFEKCSLAVGGVGWGDIHYVDLACECLMMAGSVARDCGGMLEPSSSTFLGLPQVMQEGAMWSSSQSSLLPATTHPMCTTFTHMMK